MDMGTYNYIGIDWGEKRIGLALADSENRIASPFKVVSGLEEVVEAIKNEGVERAVIGLPVSMNGDLAGGSEDFKFFVSEFKKRCGVPVELFDERLTTQQIRSLGGSVKTRAPRDAVSAMLILQAYLDKENL